jgi:hypothetical protein
VRVAEAKGERDGEERGEELPDGAIWQAFIIRGQHRHTSPTPGMSNWLFLSNVLSNVLYIVTAGGRFIGAPYPAASESSGICLTVSHAGFQVKLAAQPLSFSIIRSLVSAS